MSRAALAASCLLLFLLVACGAPRDPATERLPDSQARPLQPSEPAPERVGTDRFGEEFAALLKRAAGGEQVRVIVTLDLPIMDESALSLAEVSTQRIAIASAQSSLLLRLQATDATAVRTLSTVPVVAVAVDLAGLNALAADPSVRGITEDVILTPTLSESTAVIGAQSVWAGVPGFPGFDGAGWAIAILAKPFKDVLRAASC